MYGSNRVTSTDSRQLDQLQWLIGSWTATVEECNDAISLRCEWSPQLNEFIEWHSTTRRNREVIRSLCVMGYDPTIRKVFDVRFDNGGGVRRTLWTCYEEGRLLLGHQTGYRGECQSENLPEPDLHVMSLERIESLDEKTFLWQSTCRMKDGRPDVPPGFREEAALPPIRFTRTAD